MFFDFYLNSHQTEQTWWDLVGNSGYDIYTVRVCALNSKSKMAERDTVQIFYLSSA